MKKLLLLLAIFIASPLIGQEEELEIRWDNKNFRSYSSVLNRVDFQGFSPFETGYYPINDTLIAEIYLKTLEANVFFHVQGRFSFMLNETTLPMNKFSTGVLFGLSGFVYNKVNAMGKGTSILMYGGGFFNYYGQIGPEIGIRINHNFHKDVAITYGLDLGYHWFTYESSGVFQPIEYVSHNGFMIGMTVGFTFNRNYKKIDS